MSSDAMSLALAQSYALERVLNMQVEWMARDFSWSGAFHSERESNNGGTCPAVRSSNLAFEYWILKAVVDLRIARLD